MDLRPGAPVRLAGIDIGSVKGVRIRPELRDAPVEVTVSLMPSYELKIPNDSTATLRTAGLLGETYVALDISKAVGPPAGTNDVVETIASKQLNTEELLKRIGEMLEKKVCDLEQIKAAISANGKSSDSAP